jgi:hypothetical protein
LGDPDAVRRILDSAGFADVTFDEVRASVYYGSDVDAAFEFVSGFAMVQETAARLDVGQREHALDRLRHLLAAHRAGRWRLVRLTRLDRGRAPLMTIERSHTATTSDPSSPHRF